MQNAKSKESQPPDEARPLPSAPIPSRQPQTGAEVPDACEATSANATANVARVSWPQRTALPLLRFRNKHGKKIPLESGCDSDDGAGRVATCEPREGYSLILDELLAAGSEPPSQVFLCRVQPTGHYVVLRLLTNQAKPQQEPHVYVPRRCTRCTTTAKLPLVRPPKVHCLVKAMHSKLWRRFKVDTSLTRTASIQ